MEKTEIIERIREAREILKPIPTNEFEFGDRIKDALEILEKAKIVLIKRNVHSKGRR